ncbi:hypothetical protein [Brevibacillus porteri]|uniref:hypothetical protein n=1 Tax=Brevibacillus porteri TaxID=2126350 RepID=UPI003D1A4A3F
MITREDEIDILALAKGMGYRQPIIERIDRQTGKGIRKYGHTIDKSGHLKTSEERCEYALEEATDLIVYLEDLKAHTKRMEEERDICLAELVVIRKLLMDCLHEGTADHTVELSELNMNDLVEIRALVHLLTGKLAAKTPEKINS